MNKTNVTKLFRKFTETGKISDYLEYAKVKKDYLQKRGRSNDTNGRTSNKYS